MYSRHKTCYRKGDQLFNSYGARDNRFLITNYGFTLRQNKYNSLGFRVFLHTNRDGEADRFQKIIRIKKNKLSEDLLQYLRASHLYSYQKNNGSPGNGNLEELLVSVPVNIEFEKHILEIGMTITNDLLRNKYPTQLEADQELLNKPGLPWRTYLAVTHRTA